MKQQIQQMTNPFQMSMIDRREEVHLASARNCCPKCKSWSNVYSQLKTDLQSGEEGNEFIFCHQTIIVIIHVIENIINILAFCTGRCFATHQVVDGFRHL